MRTCGSRSTFSCFENDVLRTRPYMNSAGIFAPMIPGAFLPYVVWSFTFSPYVSKFGSITAVQRLTIFISLCPIIAPCRQLIFKTSSSGLPASFLAPAPRQIACTKRVPLPCSPFWYWRHAFRIGAGGLWNHQPFDGTLIGTGTLLSTTSAYSVGWLSPQNRSALQLEGVFCGN